jgi:CDP-diacylglycerol--serine O-phosphatidyltransferase
LTLVWKPGKSTYARNNLMATSKTRKKRDWSIRRRRLQNVAILPTLITLGNLACGVFSIFYVAKAFSLAGMDKQAAAEAAYSSAAWFIILGMVFDALDGRVARLTKSASNFGAQLDSLCDMVTFGVAPAFLVHSLCTRGDHVLRIEGIERLVTVVCVLYVLCAAVRLARFNIETTTSIDSHMDFAGIPSPASAGVIAASVISWSAYRGFTFVDKINSVVLWALPFVTLILAVLMISRIVYPHILNKLFKGPRPFVVLVELMLIGVLAVLFHEFTIFLAFLGYAVSGPIFWVRAKLRSRQETGKAGEELPEESLF